MSGMQLLDTEMTYGTAIEFGARGLFRNLSRRMVVSLVRRRLILLIKANELPKSCGVGWLFYK